jgi:hypothetical protein
VDTPDERYSDVLTNFDALLKSSGAETCEAFRTAFETGVRDATKDGAVNGLDVSMATVLAGAPSAIAADARAFVRRTEAEIRYRGPDWAKVALVGTLREYLTVLAPPAGEATEPESHRRRRG